MSEFELNSALLVEASGRREVDVRVGFSSGKPSAVSFFDRDQDAVVSISFDLWARVVDAVAKTVDLHSFDESLS